jgi:hypothetical protein
MTSARFAGSGGGQRAAGDELEEIVPDAEEFCARADLLEAFGDDEERRQEEIEDLFLLEERQRRGQQCLRAVAERIGTSEREDAPTICDRRPKRTCGPQCRGCRAAGNESTASTRWGRKERGATVNNRRHPKRQADEAAKHSVTKEGRFRALHWSGSFVTNLAKRR